ncbi:hypothetical protein F2Q68_00013070 [Brassica cretica]|uniref:Syntaxin N-terminal domain-containing protein n=1 Tax=Brassica cretica TaxID=69181 RepID=A0A8S9HL17_BRACR|nr:hypothetical protein F2Q68_00013070 [Brassica cretica]
MNDLMTKSFTSYVDLKKSAMKDLESGPPDSDLEMANNNNTDSNLSSFLEEAEKVKSEISLITETLSRISQYNDESKSAHKADSVKKKTRKHSTIQERYLRNE